MFEVDVKKVMEKGRREKGDQLRFGVLIGQMLMDFSGGQNLSAGAKMQNNPKL